MGNSEIGRADPPTGRRILVIGAPGAGKSTLSRALGTALAVPVIHFDQLYWKPNWVPRSAEEMPDLVERAICRDGWVFDGNHSRTMALRAARADTLVWLDIPIALCFARVVARSVRSYGRVRPDMAADCPERLDLTFLRWAWRFPKHSRPGLAEFFATSSLPYKHRLRSPRQVRSFLAEVESGAALPSRA